MPNEEAICERLTRIEEALRLLLQDRPTVQFDSGRGGETWQIGTCLHPVTSRSERPSAEVQTAVEISETVQDREAHERKWFESTGLSRATFYRRLQPPRRQ